MKIQNVLDTTAKKSAMDYWIDNAYVTKKIGKNKKNLPKLGKVFHGKDYGPEDEK